MQTKLKGFWEKVKAFFAKLNKKTRILLGVCAAVILVVIIAAAILLNRTEYELLQGGLNASEISNLVSFLDSNGVTDYKINGDKVYVPEGRADSLKGQLALSGNLNSGFLYEYLDGHDGITSTNKEQDRNYSIATMQKLGAIIRTFNGVQDAYVTIEEGTKQVYVGQSVTPATASVYIIPTSSKGVSSDVAEAIRKVVCFSVRGLEISYVDIEDAYGNTYSANTVSDNVSDASLIKLQYEEQTSNKIRRQVREAIERIYGQDNVSVAVTTVVDVNRKIVDSTTYHQPDGSVQGGGLIGEDQWLWEIIRDGTDPVGGTVGTTTNSDIPYHAELQPDLNGNENYANGSGERYHKIDTVTEQTEVLAFNISNVHVAVTVNQSSPNANALSTEALRSHVATAAGIGGENPENYVSVMIAPFHEPTAPPTIGDQIGILAGVPDWVIFAAIGGLLLFIILLIIILILRGRAKKKRQAQQEALEEEMRQAEALAAAEAAANAAAAAVPEGGADIMEVNTEKSMELRKTVRQFVQNNPEVAAQMVKAWLRGDEDNG